MASIYKPGKLKFLPREKWETLRGFKGNDGQRYAISNFGRIISYWDSFDFGYFLKPTLIANKYPSINLRMKGQGKTYFISKLVAKAFLKPPLLRQSFIIHLDHDKANNTNKNLKWATREEMSKHMIQNPAWATQGKRGNQKLSEAKVIKIKEKLAKGKSTLKAIATQYGVSDMQIYRIKSGENWSHLKV